MSDIIPAAALEALTAVLTFGDVKHAENPWQNGGRSVEHEIDKALGHIAKYRAGSPCDDETRRCHLDHALSRLAIAVAIQSSGTASASS